MDTSEAGPIDVVVLKFPGNRFKGEIGPALRDLVVRDLVRIVDLIFVYKDADGSVGVVELAGLGPDLEPSFVGISGQLEGGMLDAEDAEEIAPTLEPGTSAAVLAVENRWLIPFIAAVRRADGELVDQARVPSEVVAEFRDAAGPAALGSL
ncbi:DUF6325 family protein [Luteimicrobium sp. DT211]|uniref:DUF6325 family protein n=1 Tax=Luteimicrobium sp. DT211 TaxID=3393412 RepID=UPI003CEB48AD